MTRAVKVARLGLAALLYVAAPAWAQTAPSLGAAQSFAVLAGATVTNGGASSVTGNVGVSPGTAVTGFPPGTFVSGGIEGGTSAAAAAQASVTAAYNALSGQACTQVLSGQVLGGPTLTPGVYCFGTTAQLTGTLRLDAGGNANAVFIFKIGTMLTTAASSAVVMTNGGSLCNVFWQIGTSATLGASTAFGGNMIAQTSITLGASASVEGRFLARDGAVTMDTNSPAICTPPPPACPTITLTPTTLPDGTVGVAYGQTIVGNGGTGPYSFAVSAGTLPAGVTLSGAGALSGTPTAAGSSNVTIRATDANACARTLAYPIVIAAAPPPVCPTITLTPTTLPDGTVGVPYGQAIVGNGGTGPYSFAISAGTLPAGVTLSGAGALSGTPTAAGSSNVTIRATDANACAGTLAYPIVIAAAPPPVCPTITLTPGTLPDGTVGVAYSQTIVGNGGTGPYSFAVTAGTLPASVTLTGTGVLAGTPTAAGSSNVTIGGTDANACVGSLAYPIVIAAAPPTPPVCPTITLAPSSMPNGTVGVAYSQTLVGSGGVGPYSFGVTAGTLPANVTLTGAGVLAGTPASAGSSSVTIRGTDANACAGTIAYSIVIAAAPPPPPVCPTITLAPGTMPNGVVGTGYSQTIVGSGGTGPYSFGVIAGALPTSLTLTGAGVLAGTPTTAGQSTVTVRGTDANACVATIVYPIAIAALPTPPAGCPTIGLTPGAMPGGTVGVAYRQTIMGNGGEGPYSFGVTAGTLPASLTLTAAGVLAGTPGTAGQSTVTIRGSDTDACVGAVVYQIVIAAAPSPSSECPAISLDPAMPNGAVGVAYSHTVSASGGTAPYRFGVIAGALPASLTLTSAGVVAGTPTTAGQSSLTIRGTDTDGCFTERAFTMSVPTAVPTLPEAVAVMLAIGLTALGYLRLRRRARLASHRAS